MGAVPYTSVKHDPALVRQDDDVEMSSERAREEYKQEILISLRQFRAGEVIDSDQSLCEIRSALNTRPS